MKDKNLNKDSYKMSPADVPAEVFDEIKACFKGLKPKQRQFILAYAGTGHITSSAEVTGIPWIAHYRWMKKTNYKAAFEKAREIFADYAESEVFQRAFFGEKHTVFKKGEVIETYMQKSDLLAMFALKGLRPQYRDNFPIQINSSGPTQINFTLQPPKPMLPVDDPDESPERLEYFPDDAEHSK